MSDKTLTDNSGFTNTPDIVLDDRQGARAIRAGDAVQAYVAMLLSGLGLQEDTDIGRLETLYTAGPRSLFGCGRYARNVLVGTCTFSRPCRLPFVVWKVDWPCPLAIEIQNQDTSGSADAKLHKVFADLAIQPICSIVLLTGKVLTEDDGILEFARREVAQHRQRILRLFVGQAEFQRWATVERGPWPAPVQPNLI